jgi:hypothetical protein
MIDDTTRVEFIERTGAQTWFDPKTKKWTLFLKAKTLIQPTAATWREVVNAAIMKYEV